MTGNEFEKRKAEIGAEAWRLIDAKIAAQEAGDDAAVAEINRQMDENHRQLRQVESDENEQGMEGSA